jgi:hypothetical protein
VLVAATKRGGSSNQTGTSDGGMSLDIANVRRTSKSGEALLVHPLLRQPSSRSRLAPSRASTENRRSKAIWANFINSVMQAGFQRYSPASQESEQSHVGMALLR